MEKGDQGREASRYKEGKKKGYYLDPEGDTFCFGTETREGMTLCYPYKKGKQRCISMDLMKEIKEICHGPKRKEDEQKKREEQEHNAYKPGGIKAWITQEEFKKKEVLREARIKKKRNKFIHKRKLHSQKK